MPGERRRRMRGLTVTDARSRMLDGWYIILLHVSFLYNSGIPASAGSYMHELTNASYLTYLCERTSNDVTMYVCVCVWQTALRC